MTRLLMIATGLVIVIAAAAAIRLDPHLLSQMATVLDHRARHAGEDLNARLNGWITPAPGGRP